MLELSAHLAISLDGFIARSDGSMDWLRGGGPRPPAEAERYQVFMQGMDGIVLGRGTFDVVRQLPVWPYAMKPVVVLSRRTPEVPEAAPCPVEHMSGTPSEVVAQLSARGWTRLYVDGGKVVRQFLAAGLLHRLVLNRVPVLLGSGIPLFGALPADLWLEHVRTEAYPGGLVQSEYQRRRPA